MFSNTAYPSEPDLRIGLVPLNQFTMMPLTCVVECLRHAADKMDFSRQIYCQWSLLSKDKTPIRASCGFEILPTEIFNPQAKFDYLLVFAGLMPAALMAPPETRDYLQRMHAQGTPLVGIDTGVMLLAQLGLLDARECAMHFHHKTDLEENFPAVRPVLDQPFIDLGDVITCPGGARALDLILHLIGKHCGKARAQKAIRQLMIDPKHISNTSAHMPYANLTDCGDWRVEKAVALMEGHVSTPLQVSELAGLMGISTRNLTRAFREQAGESPAVVFRNIRLASSHWLLLNTNRSIAQIAYECGFADSAHFNRWFHKTYSLPPNEFRQSRKRLGQIDN